MNSKFYILIILCSGMMASCTYKRTEKNIPSLSDTLTVKICIPEKKEVSIPIFVSGQFLTDDETILSFKTGGIIEDIFVKEGDYVKKGQVLATLNLTEIKAQELQAELGYEKAKRDFERVTNLYKDSVATLEQYQNSKTALDVTNESLNGVKYNLNFSKITAVKDGYILKKYANTGQLVGVGNPILQTNGAGNDSWKFRAGLSDNEWALVAINDQAEITTDAFPKVKISGTVSRKSKGADPFSGTFSVEMDIIKPEPFLASGLYGKAMITPQNKMLVWKVPYEALIEGDSNHGYVYVTNDQKIAHKVNISITCLSKDEVYVDKGLEKVSFLIVSGSAYLTDGSLIRVYNSKNFSK